MKARSETKTYQLSSSLTVLNLNIKYDKYKRMQTFYPQPKQFTFSKSQL